MQFERVQCLVTLNEKGNTQTSAVMKAGPSAISVTEIPLLRTLHEIDGGGDMACAISMAQVVGQYDDTGANEVSRLRMIYGSRLVELIYPGGRGLPKTLADCELPSNSLAKPVRAKKPAMDE